MNAKRRVTIKDVAAAAGVSHQTVSRVINERPDVAPETRQHVLQVIEDLNYQPSAIARSLSRQHSFTLGVVTTGLQFVGPSRTLNGITEQAEEMGYTLLLKELSDFQTNEIQPILNSLLARQVDGIIWAVSEVGNNRDWLERQPPGSAIPTIFITMQAQSHLASVSIDNYQGGRMATEHLMEQGYQHIGHLSGPLEWWEARQRKAGWHDALVDAGLQVADTHWTSGTWSSASGEQAIRRLFESYPEMDAIFVANDQMALSVLQVACREGLRVPQDLAGVGFDGIRESAYFWPPLTTVYQDLRKLGRTAVRELVKTIEANRQREEISQPKTIVFDPELIVRESSRAAEAT